MRLRPGLRPDPAGGAQSAGERETPSSSPTLLDTWLLFHRGRHAKIFVWSKYAAHDRRIYKQSMQGRIAALRALGFTSHFSRALPLPLHLLDPFFPYLSFPSPSLPSHSLLFPLEVGPLNAARRFGGAL